MPDLQFSKALIFHRALCDMVHTVRENQGGGEFGESQGKSGNFFHGLEKFVFSRKTKGIF